MKNQNNSSFINTIISEIKGMEEPTMIFIAISSSMLFILDMLLLWKGHNMPNFIRIYYFYTCMISIIYYVNLKARKYRIKSEQHQKQQQVQQFHEEEIKRYFKLIKPAFDNLEIIEQFILNQFITEKSPQIRISENLFHPLEVIKNLNLKLCSLGLNIEIVTTHPIIVVQIDRIFYDLLQLYFAQQH